MSWRAEAGLALALGALLAVAAALGHRHRVQAVSYDMRASSILTGPFGSRGVYDVLTAMGRRVERRRLPLFDLARNDRHRPGLLLLADPPLLLTPAELEAVAAYLQDGGAVLAAGSGGGLAQCAGWVVGYTRGFAGESLAVRPAGMVLPHVVAWLAPDTAWRRVRRRADLGRSAPRCAALREAAVDTLLVLRDGRPVILRLSIASPSGPSGSLTLLADPGYLRNAVWKRTAAPAFILPLLTPPGPGGGPVVWDEYHQGFGVGSLTRATWSWLVRTPLGWAILQLCGVALVALAVTAVRFGPPRSVVERRRRSPLEHVDALAAGLEGAGGADTLVALVVGGLRRRLGRVGRSPAAQPPTGDVRQWLAALELALPSKRGRDAVRRLHQLVVQPGGPERALAAAQAVEDVWEELRPPSGRAAS